MILAVMFIAMAGCADSGEEIASVVNTTEQTEAIPEVPKIKTFTVSTVDELLAAIGSNTVIELKEGEYHLDEASDYGKDSDNPAYYWEEAYQGYQLVFNHLHDLTIKGSGQNNTAILASSRYADVLSFESCKRINLDGFTAGHSDGAELCSGGVIHLEKCEQIQLNNMGLFGCGTVGVSANNTRNLSMENTKIYDCSLYGLQAANCTNLYMNQCSIYDLGSTQQDAGAAVSLGDCSVISISNSSVNNNRVRVLLEMVGCGEVSFEKTNFKENNVTAFAFDFTKSQPKLIDCDLEGNSLRSWYGGRSDIALDKDEQLLQNDQLPPLKNISAQDQPKQEQIRVTTADEFLQAIGSNREIILDVDLIDFSTAAGYGKDTAPCYFWEDNFDGPQLVISDVSNLTIRAEGSDLKAHTICAIPRYANVLSFRHCSNIHLEGFTAGHTEAPGECMGGVLDFQDCDAVTVEHCGLFGCGILGVRAEFCSALTVKNCDIYECSFGGIQLFDVMDSVIEGNSFRDLGGPNVMEDRCSDLKCDIKTNEYPFPEVLD